MTNIGIAPLDPSTPIGHLRVLVRDTTSVELDPVQIGYGDYAVFSDVDLATYLISAGNNLTRAAGEAIRALALEHAAAGKSIKTDDLSIDIRSRGKDLLEVAQSFFDQAEAASRDGGAGFFSIIPFEGSTRPLQRTSLSTLEGIW